MTCNRCTDIHQAQKEGKTQESCKCNCHTEKNYTGTTTIPYTTWTNTSSEPNTTNFTASYYTPYDHTNHKCINCTYNATTQKCINCGCNSEESCPTCSSGKFKAERGDF